MMTRRVGSIEVSCPLACGYDGALPAHDASGLTLFVCPDCLGVSFDSAVLLDPRRPVDLTRAIRPVIETVLRENAIDPLTRMKNRRYFFKRLAAELRDSEHRHFVSIAAFRLNTERLYRDAGSRGGDIVLQTLAATLFAELRAGDNFARVAPNTFGLILSRSDEARAIEVAGRVAVAASAKLFHTHTGKSVSVEIHFVASAVSVGVAAEDAWSTLIARFEAHGERS